MLRSTGAERRVSDSCIRVLISLLLFYRTFLVDGIRELRWGPRFCLVTEVQGNLWDKK